MFGISRFSQSEHGAVVAQNAPSVERHRVPTSSLHLPSPRQFRCITRLVLVQTLGRPSIPPRRLSLSDTIRGRCLPWMYDGPEPPPAGVTVQMIVDVVHDNPAANERQLLGLLVGDRDIPRLVHALKQFLVVGRKRRDQQELRRSNVFSTAPETTNKISCGSSEIC